MEMILDIERAVAYIEQNLENAIEVETLAALCYVSKSVLTERFRVLCGLSIGEYIRNRRLSMAGEELALGARVLDTALKYQYESPDSFARAFRRFHGILPSEAALYPDRLCTCNPIHVAVQIIGGTSPEKNDPVNDCRRPIPAYVTHTYRLRYPGGDLRENLALVKETIRNMGGSWVEDGLSYPEELIAACDPLYIPFEANEGLRGRENGFAIRGVSWYAGDTRSLLSEFQVKTDPKIVGGPICNITVMERERGLHPREVATRLSRALGWAMNPEWRVQINAHVYGRIWEDPETGEIKEE